MPKPGDTAKRFPFEKAAEAFEKEIGQKYEHFDGCHRILLVDMLRAAEHSVLMHGVDIVQAAKDAVNLNAQERGFMDLREYMWKGGKHGK